MVTSGKHIINLTVRFPQMTDMTKNGALFGIGVSEPDVNIKGLFMGWCPGTLAYHADNGE